MRKIFILAIIISSTILGCKNNNDISPDDLQAKTEFKSLSSMRIAIVNSYIKRIEISQISLQKISTGTQKVMDFSYNYNPSVLFSTGDDMTLSVESSYAYPLVNIGKYDSGTVKVTINGQTYQGTLTTGNFDAIAGSFANKKIVFSQPATPVPGISSNYTVLIDALNKKGPINTPRPNLNIPNDLKVLGFNNITFYLF